MHTHTPTHDLIKSYRHQTIPLRLAQAMFTNISHLQKWVEVRTGCQLWPSQGTSHLIPKHHHCQSYPHPAPLLLQIVQYITNARSPHPSFQNDSKLDPEIIAFSIYIHIPTNLFQRIYSNKSIPPCLLFSMNKTV